MNTGDKGDVAETLPNLSKVYSVAVVIITLMMLFDGLSTTTPLAPLALILDKNQERHHKGICLNREKRDLVNQKVNKHHRKGQ